MANSHVDLRTAVWRKSSYTNGDGGNCLEVAEGFPGAARWRKSTYSNGDGGNCVEVVDDLPGIVPVRDSKDPHGPAIVFPAAAWTSFISAVKDTDLPSV
ncbi:DUF397 domain-containing protein [Streptomyces libani]|uniref:DUF397 domain-containing protein n=1 Tax=Streptomyces TaxID=1883 RepID=UPI00363E18BC